MGRTNFKGNRPGVNGPASGGYLVFSFGPTDLASGVTTGQRFLGFIAPCALRVVAVGFNNRVPSTTATAILYHNTTMVIAGATIVMPSTSIVTPAVVEGTALTSAGRDIAKGRFVFLDPLTPSGATSDFTCQVTAICVDHVVAAGPSGD